MSSIVTSILSSTLGLLCNKARDTTAARLKEGDITDAKLREIVVRELNDIKTKLDGLSRKDLLVSYTFLKEGVDLLNISLNKSKFEQKAVLVEAQDGETSRMLSGAESGILTQALQLSRTMGKLKINSDKDFEIARKQFKDARKKATEAFCNEALSIKDRIFAAKVRIVSDILECLETPETAFRRCLSFLKELHSLLAVKETFSVYINGGVRSVLNKAERVEGVKSIMLINYVLFQFATKFCSPSEHSFVLAWPTIEIENRSFHPILNWREISSRKSCGEELIEPPSALLYTEVGDVSECAVNSRGETVTIGFEVDSVRVISRTGESKVVKMPDLVEGEVTEHCIAGFAFDKDDNLYVVRYLIKLTENGEVRSYLLYVFDENYNVKRDCTLDFIKASYGSVGITITRHADIILIMCHDPHVYVIDNGGQLKHKFKRDSGYLQDLSVSRKNEIITSNDDKGVYLYTEEGDLESTIKVPEGHKVRGVAFHYGICKIIVLTVVEKTDSYFLLCFSETGELENSTFFCKNFCCFPRLSSHPSGICTVLRSKIITFI